ncbi:MAG: MurR/RpiR family transcriptional regulator [Pseudomonadota bacterium]
MSIHERRLGAFDNFRERVAQSQRQMPKRLSQAASYMLANPEDTALGTAASVARAADVQPSTLVRLAQHLGYAGFSDMQTVFRERLKDRSSNYEERLDRMRLTSGGDTQQSSAMLEGFMHAARQSLDTLNENVDLGQFSNAVDILSSAETIYMVARRRAYPVTAHMAYIWGKLGVRSVMVTATNGIENEIAAYAKPGDAAFVCSFSPYTPETIERTAVLADRDVPIVALTDSPLSPLIEFASVTLEVAESDFAGFRSLAASFTLSTALTVAVAEKRRGGKLK